MGVGQERGGECHWQGSSSTYLSASGSAVALRYVRRRTPLGQDQGTKAPVPNPKGLHPSYGCSWRQDQESRVGPLLACCTQKKGRQRTLEVQFPVTQDLLNFLNCLKQNPKINVLSKAPPNPPLPV